VAKDSTATYLLAAALVPLEDGTAFAVGGSSTM
jgi:hypothetical protein